MSIFSRRFGQNDSASFIRNAEKKLQPFITPFDWLVLGVFFCIGVVGLGIILAQTSVAFSSEIPVQGGTHTEGVVGTPRFINPLLSTSETDKDLTTLVFGGLMKPEPDGSVTPYLASSYEISEDGLQYTFHLKDSIFFDDGQPITAEDVVFTIQMAKNPDVKSPRRANWEGVEVVAPDEKTVLFTLRAPYALFLENTTIGILPKHLWGALAVEEFGFSDLNTRPVGSGLYQVRSVKKNTSGIPSEYILESTHTTDIEPYIKTIIFKFYPNYELLQTALINGDVNAAHSLLPSALPSTAVFEEAVFARVFGIFFNQNQQELFTDATVREALNLSIDKKKIIDTVINGYGSPLEGPLPPEKVADRESSTIDYAERLEKAHTLLENAGWERGEDGVYEKTVKKATKRLQFSLATSNAPELKASAELVVDMWRAFGVDVQLQLFDQNDLNLTILRPRKYDALLFGLVVGRDLDLFAFWHSSQRNDPGLNIALYANIAADKALEEARNELDPIARREKAVAASEEITNETAAIFLYTPHFTYVHEPELKGVHLGTISTPSDRFLGIESWYLHTERVWPIFMN